MNLNGKNNSDIRKAKQSGSSRGFSLVELLVVLGIVAIFAAVSLPYLVNYRKLYRTEDQTLKIMDLMREASQLALSRRRTMRFEIDLTDNKAYLIDERNSGASDDMEVKSLNLEPASEVRVDRIPSGISKPNPPNYNDATYSNDTIGHNRGSSRITGHNVFAARFQRDGSVVNSAGTLLSANIYIWAPVTAGSLNTRNKIETRALTVFGGSGVIRYWKHDGTTFQQF